MYEHIEFDIDSGEFWYVSRSLKLAQRRDTGNWCVVIRLETTSREDAEDIARYMEGRTFYSPEPDDRD